VVLPKIAQILAPLTNLLKGKDLPKVLPWEEWHDVAFAAAKVALVAAVPLAHRRSEAVLALATDASNTHIGGMLQQQVSGHGQPLGFFLRRLSLAEANCSTFERSCWRPTRQLITFFPR
jgi:cytoskeleton-associated protein 5